MFMLAACGGSGSSTGSDTANNTDTISSDVDEDAPVITLKGNDSIILEARGNFTDPGANVTDAVDGEWNITGTGTVDLKKVGKYTLTYNASDAAGNRAKPVTRTVIVSDNSPPVITSSTIAENLADNSGEGQKVYTIEAEDNIGVVRYGLGGRDSDFLEVNNKTGVVTLTANPNYETKSKYSFMVNAIDARGNQSWPVHPVTFSITKSNDKWDSGLWGKAKWQ